MSQVIQFTPKRDLSAQQNLNNFITLARDQLTLWSDLEGFAWAADKWPTTHNAARFINFEHSTLHRTKPPEAHQVMHPAFAEVAKAYLRYRHTLRQHKGIRREMSALRTIEYALRQDMAVPDITKFERRHWDRAISALEPTTLRQSICAAMLDILRTLADFFILTVDPSFWRHPYVGRHGYGAINGARAPDETKEKKIPDQDALLAIAEVLSRGASETQEDCDIMVTCVTALLMSAPMRISETLRFRLDYLRHDDDKNGECQHYLAYWVPKLREFSRKPVPKTMVEVTTEAIKRLSAITKEGRALARDMETARLSFTATRTARMFLTTRH